MYTSFCRERERTCSLHQSILHSRHNPVYSEPRSLIHNVLKHPEKLKCFISTCYMSTPETNCHRMRKFLLNWMHLFCSSQFFPLQPSLQHDLLPVTFCVVFHIGLNCELCHAQIYCTNTSKQKETSSWSASLKYSLGCLMSYRDRNCSALNNLCLFVTFPCGSAQWSIIIYAHSTLPVSEGRPRQCATLTRDHGGI